MEQKPNYWLVVWNRKYLRDPSCVDKFFAEVGGGQTNFSVCLDDRWPQLGEFKKDDKGLIVVWGDDKPRAVYATFTVREPPKKRQDTHPRLWKKPDVGEKMRALVCSDPYFPPVLAPDLKIKEPGHGWACSILSEVYGEYAMPVGD